MILSDAEHRGIYHVIPDSDRESRNPELVEGLDPRVKPEDDNDAERRGIRLNGKKY